MTETLSRVADLFRAFEFRSFVLVSEFEFRISDFILFQRFVPMTTETMDQKLAATAARLGIRPEQMPRNIAIIMDGNGRWAQGRSLPRYEGHSQGAKTAETVSQCCVDFGMQSLTLYSFSMENWKRPKAEVNALMHLYADYLVGIRPSLMKNNVKLVHLGRMEGLPAVGHRCPAGDDGPDRANTGMVLALALNYSGRVEIVDATRAIARACVEGRLRPEEIDEKCVSGHLYTAQITRSRPADPHGQRAARQQLPALADLLQ
jgi:undecaprenyl diphosphate synthase